MRLKETFTAEHRTFLTDNLLSVVSRGNLGLAKITCNIFQAFYWHCLHSLQTLASKKYRTLIFANILCIYLCGYLLCGYIPVCNMTFSSSFVFCFFCVYTGSVHIQYFSFYVPVYPVLVCNLYMYVCTYECLYACMYII